MLGKEVRDVTGVRPDHMGHYRLEAIDTHVLGIRGGVGSLNTGSREEEASGAAGKLAWLQGKLL